MALGLMVGAILAVPEKGVEGWSKLTFQTTGYGELWLYREDGSLAQRLRADEKGCCTSELLEEGTYYGATQEGLVQFTLTAYGVEKVMGEATSVQRQELTLGEMEETGSLTLMGEAREEWYTFELQSQDYSRTKTLRCKEGELLQWELEGIPYGRYSLLENGRILCSLEFTKEKSRVELRLP
jgi:hypothetical protein